LPSVWVDIAIRSRPGWERDEVGSGGRVAFDPPYREVRH
jgi:hypothetical protein